MEQLFKTRPNVVFLDITGLDVEGQVNLRKKLQSVGGRLLVAKKTLLKRAWADLFNNELKQDLEMVLSQPLPVALIVGKASAEVLPKAIFQSLAETGFQGESKVLAGLLGQEFISQAQVQMLATLPGKEQLQGQILGVLQNVSRQFLRVLQAPSNHLVNALYQRSIQ